MEANKISLKTLAMSIAAVLLSESVFRVTLRAASISPMPFLGFIRTCEIILLILIACRVEKSTEAIGLAPSRILAGLRKGLFWSACFGVIAGIVFLGVFAAGIDALKFFHLPLPKTSTSLLLYFAVGGVIGPIAEEIFFRGILYGFFRRWGVFSAVILSTLLFVLPHLTAGSVPITQVVGGIVFAAAYEKERNLLTPITIHCLGNLAIFSLSLFV